MKLPTNKKLTTFSGEELKDGDKPLTLGIALANILLTNETGGKMKMYALAERCYKEKELEIDAADLALIKSAVESTKIYSNLVAGQILVLLEEIK